MCYVHVHARGSVGNDAAGAQVNGLRRPERGPHGMRTQHGQSEMSPSEEPECRRRLPRSGWRVSAGGGATARGRMGTGGQVERGPPEGWQRVPYSVQTRRRRPPNGLPHRFPPSGRTEDDRAAATFLRSGDRGAVSATLCLNRASVTRLLLRDKFSEHRVCVPSLYVKYSLTKLLLGTNQLEEPRREVVSGGRSPSVVLLLPDADRLSRQVGVPRRVTQLSPRASL